MPEPGSRTEAPCAVSGDEVGAVSLFAGSGFDRGGLFFCGSTNPPTYPRAARDVSSGVGGGLTAELLPPNVSRHRRITLWPSRGQFVITSSLDEPNADR